MTDLIFFNAKVITMDPATPSARLVAVEGDRISFVAANEMPARKQEGTRIIDCAGKTLLPGFVDAHCHLHAYSESLVSLNLSPREGVQSIRDIQDKIRDYCTRRPAGGWIRGKGYNEFYLAEKRHPNRWDLDAAAPLHPVKLTHRSGHAHVLNSLALALAGIHEETGDPPEGLIDREIPTGLPTGILYGLSTYLAEKIPPVENAELEKGAALASRILLRYGTTSVQDASFVNGLSQWRRFEDWKICGAFLPRITMMTGLNSFLAEECQSFATRLAPAELGLGAVKIIADEVTGSLHPSQEELNEAVEEIHAAGRHAAIHAIEEPVIEAAACAIESADRKMPRRGHRHRIEHCSVCSPRLLQRLARLGAIIVTQPSFVYDNGDRYLQTVPGNRLDCLYALRSMLDHGLLVGAGSDFPISDPNPMLSIYAAVTRRARSGAGLPQPGITAMEALRMHTLHAAATNFEDELKGSLSPGKFADIVMLSENPLEVDPEHIKDIRVLMTVLGGKIAFSEE
jgi:predicted amidohydrolase YtcJ